MPVPIPKDLDALSNGELKKAFDKIKREHADIARRRRDPGEVSDREYEQFVQDTAGLQVDMTSLPSVGARQNKKPDADQSFIDPLFAPLADDRPHRLRKAIPTFVNAHRNDPEIARVLREGGVKDNSSDAREGTVFVTIRGSGEEIPVDISFKDGFWTASAKGKKYSAETRDVLLSVLVRDLQENVRELNDNQLREISILCQSHEGGFYRGVARFVSLMTGLTEDEAWSDAAFLNPHNAASYDRAVSFCFLACSPDFSPDDDWQSFLAHYANGRHLSAALCQGARCAYEVQRQEMERQSILSRIDEPTEPEEPPTYAELDELPDEAVENQLRKAKREYSKLVRAGVL